MDYLYANRDQIQTCWDGSSVTRKAEIAVMCGIDPYVVLRRLLEACSVPLSTCEITPDARHVFSRYTDATMKVCQTAIADASSDAAMDARRDYEAAYERLDILRYMSVTSSPDLPDLLGAASAIYHYLQGRWSFRPREDLAGSIGRAAKHLARCDPTHPSLALNFRAALPWSELEAALKAQVVPEYLGARLHMIQDKIVRVLTQRLGATLLNKARDLGALDLTDAELVRCGALCGTMFDDRWRQVYGALREVMTPEEVTEALRRPDQESKGWNE